MDWILALQLLTTAADWNQTRQIAANPGHYYELNPILGQHPSAAAVNRHFAIYEGVVLAGAYAFPSYRNNILGISATVEAGFVAHNYSIGLKVNF